MPFDIVWLLGRWLEIPKIDTSREVRLECFVIDVFANTFGSIFEGCVDSGEDRRGRAEGICEFAALKPACVFELLPEFFRSGVEATRIRALEAIDRLLFVTNDENGTWAIRTRAFTCSDLGRQRFDDIPLRRAGVLSFVDQYVVDPAVKTVEHPSEAVLSEEIAGF